MKMKSCQTEREQGKGETGASQNLLLGILAVLIALLGYLYFFTDMIKQRENQQQAPPVIEQKIKQPIPPRPSASTAKDDKPAAVPAATVKPEAPLAPVKTSNPSAPDSAAVPPKPAPEKKSVSKAAAPVASKTESKQQVPQVKPQDKPADVVINSVKNTDPKPKNAKAVSETRYSIVATGILPAKADLALAEMRKYKFENITKKHLSEVKSMKRLFVSVFEDSQTAHAELEKVKKVSPGSFLVTDSGKLTLFAGSYANDKRAESEVRRLSTQGLNVSIKQAKLTLPVVTISGIAFSKANADECAKRLGKLGIESVIKKLDGK